MAIAMPKGLFESPGTRGYRSAEAQVLRRESLVAHEVRRVLDISPGGTVTVETACGRCVGISRRQARELGLQLED